MSPLVETIQLRKPFNVLRNGALSLQAPELLLQHGHTVANLLKQLGGEHTFHPQPEELKFAMATNHALLAKDPETESVAGFVKAVPWLVGQDIKQHMLSASEDIAMVESGLKKAVCVEVGSLVVAREHQGNHLGSHLAQQVITHATEAYPHLPIIAVVTNDNLPSLAVFHNLAWEVVGQKQATGLLGINVLEDWPPPSTIFCCPSL